jgi:tetratricopeptide (TPR) repeat protein
MEKIKWIEEYLEEALRLACDEGHEPALTLLDKLLYEEPGYGRLHNVLGKVYLYYAEEIASAEKHFRMAIRFDPTLADTYIHLGRLLCEEERHDEAIEVYTKGLNAKQASKSGLLFGAGKAYELKKKYKKAIAHYKDALSHSAELWNCMALEESIKRCKRKEK